MMRSVLEWLKLAFSGLRFRLLLLLLLVCAPLIALIFHSAGEDRRRAQVNWAQRARNVAQIARREQHAVAASSRQLLLAVSEALPMRSLNSRRVKGYLEQLWNSYRRYSNLGLIATNGELVASVFPVPQNLGAQHIIRQALERRIFAVGTPGSSASARPAVYFAQPMLDGAGRPLGVIFAELDPARFAAGSEIPSRLPRGATWMEINPQGAITARFPWPERWNAKLGLAPWLRTNIQTAAAGSGIVEGGDGNGKPSFYALTPLESAFAHGESYGILGIPRQILFAEADRTLRRNLTWLAAAFGVALVLGWFGSQLLILRPVKALVRSSARLAAGDLAARTGLRHGHDELGQLTFAFDQMAQALEQRELDRERANQKLHVLSHRLVEIQESERRHIARELHDEIGQSLTAAELNLQAALQSPKAACLEQRLEASIKAVERVLEQVHDLSLNLRPSMLDDLGLESALRWYVQRQSALTGMRAEFQCEHLDERLDPMVETECFRVAQEALTNVVRHSQARAVRVELSRKDGRLHLRVRDDGVGFDVGASRSLAVRGASLGLLSMEERAALAGGGLEFCSAPGGGTEVRAWFPLESRQRSYAAQFDEQRQ